MDEIGIGRVIAALAFVIGLILAASVGLRRLRGTALVEKIQGMRRIQLLEQFYLDARHKLVLVKCGESEHLLLLSGQSATLVSSQTAPVATLEQTT